MSKTQRALLISGSLVAAVGLSLLVLDYFQTRSATQFGLLIARLGPGTSIDSYIAELGQPIHHFTEHEEMKAWEPSADDSLLRTTELYYFGYRGLPHRFVVVYADKGSRRSTLVTWKGM